MKNFPWRELSRLADSLERSGIAAAETSLELHDTARATSGNAYAATADVLKSLAWAMTVSSQQKDATALGELADLVNEWAAGQRISLAAANN